MIAHPRVPERPAYHVPDSPLELPGWLEYQLLGPVLAEVVDKLQRIAPVERGIRLSVAEILGRHQQTVLEKGFAELPLEVLGDLRDHLIRQPSLLFALQELVYVEGEAYWDNRLLQASAELTEEFDDVIAGMRSGLENRIMGRKRRQRSNQTTEDAAEPRTPPVDSPATVTELAGAVRRSEDGSTAPANQPEGSPKAGNTRHSSLLGRMHRYAWRHKGLGLLLVSLGSLAFTWQRIQSENFITQETLQAQAEGRFGTACWELGHYDLAERAQKQALARLERLVARSQRTEPQKDLAEGHLNLGRALCKSGRLLEAEREHQLALIGLNGLAAKHPDAREYVHDQAISHLNLAGLHHETGRPVDAEKAYRRAIELLTRLTAVAQSLPDYELALACCQFNLGKLLVSCFRFREAHAEYEVAEKRLAKLVANYPDRLEYRDEWASCLNDLGMLLTRTDSYREAQETLEQALKVSKELVAKCPSRPCFRQMLAISHDNKGLLLQEMNRSGEAEVAYRKALDVLDALVDEFPSVPGYRLEQARTQYRLSGVLLQQARQQEADEALVKARAFYTRLVDDLPSMPEYRGDLGNTLLRLGLLAQERGELDAAAELMEKAVVQQKQALALCPKHPVYRQYLRNTLIGQTRVLLESGKHDEAAHSAAALTEVIPDSCEGYLRAAKFLSLCVASADKDEWLTDGERLRLTHVYGEQFKQFFAAGERRGGDTPAFQNELAWLLVTFPAEQFRDGTRAVKLAKEAVARAPENGAFWNTLGVACYRAGDWKSAKAALEQSILLRSGGSRTDWFFLAMVYCRLGDPQQARQWYEKATQGMGQREDEEMRGFHAEAAELLGSQRGDAQQKLRSSVKQTGPSTF